MSGAFDQCKRHVLDDDDDDDAAAAEETRPTHALRVLFFFLHLYTHSFCTFYIWEECGGREVAAANLPPNHIHYTTLQRNHNYGSWLPRAAIISMYTARSYPALYKVGRYSGGGGGVVLLLMGLRYRSCARTRSGTKILKDAQRNDLNWDCEIW